MRKIIRKASRVGSVIGVIGGLHSLREFKLLKKMEFVSPAHCTKYTRRIEEIYPEKLVKNGVEREIESA